jgi:hypothetical protein
MKPVKISRSPRLLCVFTFTVVAALFTATACAGDPATPRSRAPVDASRSEVASQWVGVYDGFSRACEGYPLTISKSTFTWGDCNAVTIRVIAASDTELAFEVDPNAKCGWAGLIVALTTPSLASRAVSVNAYRTLIAYQGKESDAFCAYYKRID